MRENSLQSIYHLTKPFSKKLDSQLDSYGNNKK